ncbi:MAG TPA: thiamine-phosphate kinase [Candidatus Acidoferrales bacterium]|nr:thiamine-phosphate kinase [Candidatus Acidoferrales bacterium]
MTTEAEIIARIHRRLGSAGGRFVRLGIGDDAAILRPSRGAELLVTCDPFLEGVHFLREKHRADVVGYKALARATSDIAAMGGVPRCFLLGLALPETHAGKWLDGFLAGMRRAARRFGMVLAGGDTSKHRQILVQITVLGEIAAGKAILRSGARLGDLIYVSGRLGEAQLGLEVILRGRDGKRGWRGLLRKHLHPEPRLALGQWLAAKRLASAMIDVSDGLSTDLGHVCEASGAGARVFSEKIPQVRVPEDLRRRGVDPQKLALDGGEDYELLFTVPRRMARRLPTSYRGVLLTAIGEITRGGEIVLIERDGRVAALRPHGWDPFRAV